MNDLEREWEGYGCFTYYALDRKYLDALVAMDQMSPDVGQPRLVFPIIAGKGGGSKVKRSHQVNVSSEAGTHYRGWEVGVHSLYNGDDKKYPLLCRHADEAIIALALKTGCAVCMSRLEGGRLIRNRDTIEKCDSWCEPTTFVLHEAVDE